MSARPHCAACRINRHDYDRGAALPLLRLWQGLRHADPHIPGQATPSRPVAIGTLYRYAGGDMRFDDPAALPKSVLRRAHQSALAWPLESVESNRTDLNEGSRRRQIQ